MIGFRGKFLGKLHVSYNCKIKQNQLYVNGELISEKNYYKIVTVDLLSRGMGYKSLKRHKEYALLKETIQEAITNAINDEKAYVAILFNDDLTINDESSVFISQNHYSYQEDFARYKELNNWNG